MKFNKSIFVLFFALALFLIPVKNVNAGIASSIHETDTKDPVLVGAFDLRDRETFIQITHTFGDATPVHIQFFNVGDNCNENNFFDFYTQNDTHVYNVRDIVTNDSNPAGFVLPSDAYGIFVAVFTTGNSLGIGNLRIVDNSGYEYRTNLNAIGNAFFDAPLDDYTFNFNTEGGVILSDVFGMSFDLGVFPDLEAANIIDVWVSFDIDLFDLNEVPFSCRNVIFACTDQNNPLLEELLEFSGDASVASFEYGINEAIPSSKDAPLLCPSNVISEGFVRMRKIATESDFNIVLFIGLNNGNGRGSMDSLWYDNSTIDPD